MNFNDLYSPIFNDVQAVEGRNFLLEPDKRLSTRAINKALRSKKVEDITAALEEARLISESGNPKGASLTTNLQSMLALAEEKAAKKEAKEATVVEPQAETVVEEPKIDFNNVKVDYAGKSEGQPIATMMSADGPKDIYSQVQEQPSLNNVNVSYPGKSDGEPIATIMSADGPKNIYSQVETPTVEPAPVVEETPKAEESVDFNELRDEAIDDYFASLPGNQIGQPIEPQVTPEQTEDERIKAQAALNDLVKDEYKVDAATNNTVMPETVNTTVGEEAPEFGSLTPEEIESLISNGIPNTGSEENKEVNASEEPIEAQAGYDGVKEAVTFLENALDNNTYYYEGQTIDEGLSYILDVFDLTESIDESDIFKIDANNATIFLKQNGQNLTDERLNKLNDYLEMDDVYNQFVRFKEIHEDFNMYDPDEQAVVSNIITNNYHWTTKERIDEYGPVVLEMLDEVANNKKNNMQEEKSEVDAENIEDAMDDLLLAARNLTNSTHDSIDEYLFRTTRGNLYNGTNPKYQDQVAAIREKEIEYTKILNEKDTLDFSDSKAVSEWFNRLIPYINTHALTLNPGLDTYNGSGEDYLLSIMAENGYTATLNNPKDETTKDIKEKLKELYETNYIPSEYANLPKEFADLNSEKSMAVAQVLRNDTIMRKMEIAIEKNKQAGSIADLDMDAINKVGIGLQNASDTLYDAYDLNDEDIKHSIRPSRYSFYKEYEKAEAPVEETKEEATEKSVDEPVGETSKVTEEEVVEKATTVEPEPVAEAAPEVAPTKNEETLPAVIEPVDVNKHSAAKFIAIKAFKGIKRVLYDRKSDAEIKESIKAAVAKMKETGTAIVRKINSIGKTNFDDYFAFSNDLDELADKMEAEDAKAEEKEKIKEYIELVDQLNAAGRIDVGKLSNEALKKALKDDSPEVREAMDREMAAADLLKKDIEEQEKIKAEAAKKEAEQSQEANSESQEETAVTENANPEPEPTVQEQQPEQNVTSVEQQLVQMDAEDKAKKLTESQKILELSSLAFVARGIDRINAQSETKLSKDLIEKALTERTQEAIEAAQVEKEKFFEANSLYDIMPTAAPQESHNDKEWDTNKALDEATKVMQAEKEVSEAIKRVDPNTSSSEQKESLDKNGWVDMSNQMNTNPAPVNPIDGIQVQYDQIDTSGNAMGSR